MIRPAQLKLLERARVECGWSEARFAETLQRWGGVERPEALSPAGFDRVLDRLILHGFRDRSRPLLSTRTRQMLEEARLKLRVSDFAFATILRTYGKVGDIRDLGGKGLLTILACLESYYGLDVAQFIAERRQIGPKQLRVLQVARKQVRPSDDAYYTDLQAICGVNSASDLDQRGFGLMMMLMEIAGFGSKPAPVAGPAFGERPGFASPEQVDLIRSLWREWLGPTTDSDEAIEAGLNGWLEQYHRTSSLRFLKTAGAGKVITALRAMKSRRTGKARGDKQTASN